MPAIVTGVSAQDGAAPKMIAQLADGIGAYTVLQRTTAEIGPIVVAKIENKGRQNRRVILAFAE